MNRATRTNRTVALCSLQADLEVTVEQGAGLSSRSGSLR
jgi:hypothetical protein